MHVTAAHRRRSDGTCPAVPDTDGANGAPPALRPAAVLPGARGHMPETSTSAKAATARGRQCALLRCPRPITLGEARSTDLQPPAESARLISERSASTAPRILPGSGTRSLPGVQGGLASLVRRRRGAAGGPARPGAAGRVRAFLRRQRRTPVVPQRRAVPGRRQPGRGAVDRGRAGRAGPSGTAAAGRAPRVRPVRRRCGHRRDGHRRRRLRHREGDRLRRRLHRLSGARGRMVTTHSRRCREPVNRRGLRCRWPVLGAAAGGCGWLQVALTGWSGAAVPVVVVGAYAEYLRQRPQRREDEVLHPDGC